MDDNLYSEACPYVSSPITNQANPLLSFTITTINIGYLDISFNTLITINDTLSICQTFYIHPWSHWIWDDNYRFFCTLFVLNISNSHANSNFH